MRKNKKEIWWTIEREGFLYPYFSRQRKMTIWNIVHNHHNEPWVNLKKLGYKAVKVSVFK